MLGEIQVILAPRDRETLNKDFIKSLLEPTTIDYIQFYKKVKNLQDQAVVVKLGNYYC